MAFIQTKGFVSLYYFTTLKIVKRWKKKTGSGMITYFPLSKISCHIFQQLMFCFKPNIIVNTIHFNEKKTTVLILYNKSHLLNRLWVQNIGHRVVAYDRNFDTRCSFTPEGVTDVWGVTTSRRRFWKNLRHLDEIEDMPNSQGWGDVSARHGHHGPRRCLELSGMTTPG